MGGTDACGGYVTSTHVACIPCERREEEDVEEEHAEDVIEGEAVLALGGRRGRDALKFQPCSGMNYVDEAS